MAIALSALKKKEAELNMHGDFHGASGQYRMYGEYSIPQMKKYLAQLGYDSWHTKPELGGYLWIATVSIVKDR